MAKSAEGKGSSGGIVAILLVTLLGAGAGGGLGFYLAGDLKAKTAEQKPHREAAKSEEKSNVPANSKIVEITPIIANIGDPSTAWMRVEASLIVAGDVDEGTAKTLAATIAGDVTAYIKTVSLAQFEGASGYQALREDLNDRARVRGGAQVRELVIHGIVVE